MAQCGWKRQPITVRRCSVQPVSQKGLNWHAWLNRNWATRALHLKYTSSYSAGVPGAAKAHFVPAQSFRAQVNSLSPPPGLCQPLFFPKRQASFRMGIINGGSITMYGEHNSVRSHKFSSWSPSPTQKRLSWRSGLKMPVWRSCGEVRWVPHVTPRILGHLFRGETLQQTRTCGWSQDWI